MAAHITATQRQNLIGALVDDWLCTLRSDYGAMDPYIRDWLTDGRVGYAEMLNDELISLAEDADLDIEEILARDRLKELREERAKLAEAAESASGLINEDGTPSDEERNARTVLDIWDEEHGAELRELANAGAN